MEAVKLLLVLSFLPMLSAQPVPAKPKVEEYPAHASGAKGSIGAELMVHVVSSDGKSYFVPDYLTVEVAVYPLKEESLMVAISHFTLRINGKKQELLTQSPGFAASSLKYPQFSSRPSGSASAGIGMGGVTIGGPRQQPRVPGEEGSTGPTISNPTGNSTSSSDAPVTAADAVVNAALAEGPATHPIAGYLYFPFQGDGKKAKKVELIYRGPAGEITLPLR